MNNATTLTASEILDFAEGAARFEMNNYAATDDSPSHDPSREIACSFFEYYPEGTGADLALIHEAFTPAVKAMAKAAGVESIGAAS